MMKMTMRHRQLTLLLAAGLLSGFAHAATIGFSPPGATVAPNDSFNLAIVGTDFDSVVDGGGLDIAFDPTVVNVLSVSIDESVWNLGVGISEGLIDNDAGRVTGIMVNAFSDVGPGDFIVASVAFRAVAPGISPLLLTEAALNPWASGGEAINPAFLAADVTVVPLPAPAALLLTAFLPVLSAARRRKGLLP